MRLFIIKLLSILSYPLLRLIRGAVRVELQAQSQDLSCELQARARHRSADYVIAKLGGAKQVRGRLNLMDLAIDSISIKSGLVLEFGVYRGESINHIANNVKGSVFGFDSFEGLPEYWREGFDKGAFSLIRLPNVKNNVTLIKGWFNETLPNFLSANAGDVALLHVDCDLYSSTVTIFDALRERLPAGTVIVFDEYFNYPGWEDGEFKAFQEFCIKYNRAYRYLAYNAFHEQVAVVMQ